MTACPDAELWPRLLDGDLAERDAKEMRAHALACARCSAQLEATDRLLAALATPSVQHDDRRVRALMQAVDLPKPRRHTWQLALVGAAALVVAAVAVRTSRSEFAARGSAAAWQQKVRAEVRALGRPAEAISDGAALKAGAPLAVWYRNLEADEPLYVLAYLVDGEGEIHWIVPSWREGAAPPLSPRLPRVDGAALMPEAFVAESPAPGSAALVTVVSKSPLSVETIEHGREPDGAVVWRAAIRLEP